MNAPVGGVRYLYIHLPFCAHRCGYCDFVTVVGRAGEHGAYAEALLAELDVERQVLAEELETVFVGGGTPTFTEPRALERVLRALPPAREVTVEANPETVDAALAALLRRCGVTRVSLGAQSFVPHLLQTLERSASPDAVRAAVHTLRDVGSDNISLDLLYGIPGQEPADLDHDLAEALALAPEHLSLYELEAKPGTRFTVAYGDELVRQAEAMEGYFERVVGTLTSAGYRWYETASFCLERDRAGGRDLRAHHNLGYWCGHDYLGIGVGAVSTLGTRRLRNAPSLGRYVEALRGGGRPPRAVEHLEPETKAQERVMLGLRLDEPLVLGDDAAVLDRTSLARLRERRLLESGTDVHGRETLRLTTRGRFLGGAVTAELLA